MSELKNEWLTQSGLGEEYFISIFKQRRLRRERKIPFSKIGNAVMYKRSEIEQWLENHKVN